MYDPPLHFAIVQEGVFRCNTPSRKEFPFVNMLQLKTAVLLSPDRPLREVCRSDTLCYGGNMGMGVEGCRVQPKSNRGGGTV